MPNPMIRTNVFALLISMLNHHMVYAKGSAKAEEVSPLKKFLTNMGVNLDPTIVIVGLVILLLMIAAASYFW